MNPFDAFRGRRISVVEVGPRDGLQNERATISTPDKIELVNLLSAAGFPVVEVSAFVSPKWVPQMADADAVLAGITRRPETRYAALVPNLAGLARASHAGVDQIAVFAAASNTFSRRNLNQDIEESLATYRDVCNTAAASRLPVRAYLSTAFGCPYEGPVGTDVVVSLVRRLLDLGAYEVAISDTIGIAQPGQVGRLLDAVLAHTEVTQVALHFHDTRGTALANVLAALSFGIHTFDASAGGLGGCPFAPGAAGNLATEDLIYMLDGLEIETGVSLTAVSTASAFIGERLDHVLPSRYAQAKAATRREA